MKNWKITKFFTNFGNPFFKFVKTRDFPEFLNFLKFALSIYDVSERC